MTHTIPTFESAEDPGYKFLRVFGKGHMTRGETITLNVEGGVPPYDWEVDSDLFTFGSAQTNVQSNTITAADNAISDQQSTVTVADAEGSEVEIVVCVCDVECCADDDVEAMTFDDENTPDEVDLDGSIDLYMSDGCSPYTWEITSEGDEEYTLDEEETELPQNVLSADYCADEDVDIKVTDACGTEVEFTIDASSQDDLAFDNENTPDTIDPGDSITLYITGGKGPFNWSVEGTGYTLFIAQTSGRQNSLTSVSGTCGADYDPYATITVTDSCGVEVTGEAVRNTGGQWNSQGSASADVTGCVYSVVNCSYNYDIIGGYQKWQMTNGQCYCIIPGCQAENWVGSVPEPPCGSPLACSKPPVCSGSCGIGAYECVTLSYQYFTWGCP